MAMNDAMTNGTQFGYATTERGAWLILTMARSQAPIPDVRRWALRESIRVARDEESIKSILIDALCGSPYIPEAHKAALGEILVFGMWDQVPKALACPPILPTDPPMDIPQNATAATAKSLLEFRQMALAIFTKSRKIARLPAARRIQLGQAICRTRSKEELITLMLTTLEHAMTLEANGRALVANDVLDGHFYKLILEDRFDCTEVPRQPQPTPQQLQLQSHLGSNDTQNINTDDNRSDSSDSTPSAPPIIDEFECPICLGVEIATIDLRCGHKFCRGCITEWTRGEATFSCPMCRAEIQSSSIV